MNKSFRIISLWGIDLRVHITFPLILAWAALQFGIMFGSLAGAVFGIVAISLLFVLVTLHELGHSFAARAYDVPVKQIILTPIGGVAQLMRMPEKPEQELLIAIAGPAVNIVIALIMAALAMGVGIDIVTLLSTFSSLSGTTLLTLFSYIFVSNIFLALFNLIPAFPMDGGRILRALLAMRMNYARATNIAAGVGRIAAVLLGIYGLLNGNFFMIMIAIFIFGAGTQEARATQARDTLQGYKVQQAFSTSTYRLETWYTLQQASNMMSYSGQKDFAVVSGDRLVGFLPYRVLQNALSTKPSYTPVSDVMIRNTRPVFPSTDLYTVQQRLVSEKIGALPVVSEGGGFEGIISQSHIADLFRLVKSKPPIASGPQSI
ncbi:MAG: site-2 protease family protein [Candidatus Promineifilaceae bacterium]|nr:site-2 protease family protein [Candidatus Promineifilaceae bacterium]